MEEDWEVVGSPSARALKGRRNHLAVSARHFDEKVGPGDGSSRQLLKCPAPPVAFGSSWLNKHMRDFRYASIFHRRAAVYCFSPNLTSRGQSLRGNSIFKPDFLEH